MRVISADPEAAQKRARQTVSDLRVAHDMPPAPPPWDCPWCGALAGEPCTARRGQAMRLSRTPTRCHPARLERTA